MADNSAGRAIFQREVYGNSGGGSSGGSNNAGVGLGGASQISRRMNMRKPGRNKSRGKRK